MAMVRFIVLRSASIRAPNLGNPVVQVWGGVAGVFAPSSITAWFVLFSGVHSAFLYFLSSSSTFSWKTMVDEATADFHSQE